MFEEGAGGNKSPPGYARLASGPARGLCFLVYTFLTRSPPTSPTKLSQKL